MAIWPINTVIHFKKHQDMIPRLSQTSSTLIIHGKVTSGQGHNTVIMVHDFSLIYRIEVICPTQNGIVIILFNT